MSEGLSPAGRNRSGTISVKANMTDDNIRVGVRMRPLISNERDRGNVVEVWKVDGTNIYQVRMIYGEHLKEAKQQT
jgi:hypothetical protein